MLNYFKSLVIGEALSESDPSLASLSLGKLYHIDNSRLKNKNSLLYNSSSISITTSSLPNHYQLLVVAVYDDGEKDLLNDNDDDFEVEDEDLMFKFDEKNWSFLWKDLDPLHSDRMFEFVPLEADGEEIKQFQLVFDKCRAARNLKIDYIDVTDSQLKKSDLPQKQDRSFVTEEITGEIIKESTASLYLYDIQCGEYVPCLVNASVSLVNQKDKSMLLAVSQNSVPYITQSINERMNPVFNKENLAFFWVWIDSNSVPSYSWSIRFSDLTKFNIFKNDFVQTLYQVLNNESFTKVKKMDQDAIIDAYIDDVIMTDDFSDNEEEVHEESDNEEEEEDNAKPEKDELNEDDSYARSQLNQDLRAENSQLAVGYKNNSFVVRGSKIGVFRNTSDDKLQFATTINDVQTSSGELFSPRKIMLHEQDSSMLMMKPGNEHQIFRMDLEYGKIVDEWKVDDIMPVTEILPSQKYAQQDPGKTFLGLNQNSLFRIDPRLSTPTKRVESESKTYVAKNKFTSATTTGKGEVAVASAKGEIRLFDKLGMRAKSLVAGLGEEISSIDVTENGEYIIGTCKTFLILVKTLSNEGVSMFKKGLPADKKPTVIRLQLKPEHVAMMKTAINFTPAKFNTGRGLEKTIVTSTGPFIITWNFRRVKKGGLYDYQIKSYGEDVVADNFNFGQDRSIIVTLKNDVEMVNKSMLSTPTKMLKSRNSIVNSPY